MDTVVRLLGPPRIRVGDETYEPAPSRASALAYYLAYRRTWVDRAEVCALFWPERDEAAARTNLRQLLRVVRADPCYAGIAIEPTRLRWAVATDMHDELPEADRGREAVTGVLLEGYHLSAAAGFEAWLDEARANVAEHRRSRALGSAAESMAAGEPARAMVLLESCLRTDPLDEPVLQEYLTACRAAGRDGDARRRFDAFQVRLASELGLAPTTETVDLVVDLLSRPGRVRDDASDAPGVPARWPGRPPDRLAGRDGELEFLERRLRTPGAVVTVTGPGGIGKTALALHAAARLLGAYDGDVHVVPLAEAATAEEAAADMANAMGPQDAVGQAPLEHLVQRLRDRRCLFVLDNVDQVSGIGALVATVAKRRPTTVILLTSRRRPLEPKVSDTLELGGLPAGDEGAIVEDEATAAALFLSRAQRLGARLDASADAAAIRELCRVIGGMPLGVELAARWARYLSPTDLARRFADELADQPPPGDDLDARHRTMERVFDASWRSLRPRDRSALLRLSVFRGGCTVAAAEEIAGIGLGQLVNLRDASMVWVSRDGRVTQHPLIERFVRVRAAAGPANLALVRERHARAYLAFLRQQEDAGQSTTPREAVAALQREHPNLEPAWSWALEHGLWEPLSAGGAMFGLSYALAGRAETWNAQLEEALRRIPRDHLSWAVLEAHLASLDVFVGRHRSAYERCRGAWRIAANHDAPWERGWVAFHLGDAAHAVGRGDEAREAMHEAAAMWHRVGDPGLESMALIRRYNYTVDFEGRAAIHREEVEVRRRLGDSVHQAEAAVPRGLDVAFDEGRYGEALDLLSDAVAIQREVAWNDFDLAVALAARARVYLAFGDLEGSERDAEEASTVMRAYGRVHYVDLRAAVACRAAVRLLAGQYQEVAALLSAPLPHGTRASAAMYDVRARLALAQGDPVSADRAADAARSLLDAPTASREALRDRIGLRLLDAEIAQAGRHHEVARQLVATSLEEARRATVLPHALHAVALAAPWLPASQAERGLAAVAAAPETSYAVRCLPNVRATSRPAFAPIHVAGDRRADIESLVDATLEALSVAVRHEAIR